MSCHYVYRLTLKEPFDSRKYYVGKHSGKLDDFFTGKYATSSKKVRQIYSKDVFNVKIIKTFESIEDALHFEGKYHRRLNVQAHDKFFNEQNQTPSGKLDRTNMVTVINKTTGERLNVSVDNFRKNDDMVMYNADTVLCKNILTNEVNVVSKKEFDENDNLVGINKGIIHCVLKETGERVSIPKEEYDPELHSHTFAGIAAYDTVLKKKVNVPKDVFHGSDRYVGIKAFTKEGTKTCELCKASISLSNYDRHVKRHSTSFIWVTDNENNNSYKVTEADYYLKLKDGYYIIESNKDKTYGYSNGKEYNIRYIGRIHKNLKPGETL